ncbi:MAG TPA: exonuclease domain-containing protein [Niabella sp.]|nr:exonuclease domain-containing protein [Niabella sp.]HRB07450.1 exonuclease domain-containing protein [Niabella sp.]HRB34009.1 exonuclease domain-containing protein [Niabella sp.]HRB51141.1 exonuclease domain-containing protein [Niabella sp.]HRB58346.1 exonuclease domain-containing protein [Niabella sp.]
MFNFFKPKPKNQIEMEVTGVNPETNNEFLFFNFVENTPNYILEPWLKKAKQVGYKVKPQYEATILQKIKSNQFKNPYTFPEYFQNKFDFIAIDFETANNSRLSACAIGLCFVKNDTIVYSTKHYIKPPATEKFLKSHIAIHGITFEDVEFAFTFQELWDNEFSKYISSNLLIFHNASMDLSILKNLYEHYNIKPYNIKYIDTMLFADKLGMPRRIKDLAVSFNLEVTNHHNPEFDAKLCALIFGELVEKYPNYEELIRKINDKPKTNNNYFNQPSEDILEENEEHLFNYKITQNELENINLIGKGIVITGNFSMEREEIKTFLMKSGVQIKSGITSKVDFVFAGEDFGWSKIQKINELNQSGKANIKILDETNLNYLIKKYGI